MPKQPVIKHNRRHSYVGTPNGCALCGESWFKAIHGRPIYADSFGYSLAMRVLQSDLYSKLDEKERAECDELIRRGQ